MIEGVPSGCHPSFSQFNNSVRGSYAFLIWLDFDWEVFIETIAPGSSREPSHRDREATTSVVSG